MSGVVGGRLLRSLWDRPAGPEDFEAMMPREGPVIRHWRGEGAEGVGIVVVDPPVEEVEDEARPRIEMFVWGGKVRPQPTLPYGRWKATS